MQDEEDPFRAQVLTIAPAAGAVCEHGAPFSSSFEIFPIDLHPSAGNRMSVVKHFGLVEFYSASHIDRFAMTSLTLPKLERAVLVCNKKIGERSLSMNRLHVLLVRRSVLGFSIPCPCVTRIHGSDRNSTLLGECCRLRKCSICV